MIQGLNLPGTPGATSACRGIPLLYFYVVLFVGRDGAFVVATGYGLDGPEIKSRCERDFPHPYRPILGPTQPPTEWIPDHFLEVKRPRRGVNIHPHLAPRLKKEYSYTSIRPLDFIGRL